MADAKLTALSAINAISSGDLFYVVDADTGTTPDSYKVTANNLQAVMANPFTNDARALGSATLSWSDLFLADSGVINWANGDITLTQVGQYLRLGGATAFTPGTADGAALGDTGQTWSDIFLASGAVINFNIGDVTITHNASNQLSFGGAAASYRFNAPTGAGLGTCLQLSTDGVAVGDGPAINFYWADFGQLGARIGIYAQAAATADLLFLTGNSGAPAERLRILADGRLKATLGQVAHFWVYWTANSTTILASHNVTGIDDDAVGDAGINLTTGFSSNNFAAFVDTNDTTNGWDNEEVQASGINVHTASTVDVLCSTITDGTTAATSLTDPDQWQACGFGVSA